MTTTAITTSSLGVVEHGLQAIGNWSPERRERLRLFADLSTSMVDEAADDLRRGERALESRARGAAPESLAAARKADSDPPVRPV